MSEELFGNKKCPFEVPENYFGDFETRMLKKIEAESAAEVAGDKVGSVISVVKPWLAMAAAFVIIALLYYQVPKLFPGDAGVTQSTSEEDDFINSLALIVDEKDINELILTEGADIVLAPDSVFYGTFSEEELAAVTYFE
ncbi:hypothetical protein [Marinilabilia salmonicolor]|uniref:hypothetical protein n=2 Tax=Marinilabilia salmonicolor TaxID=989 RepID=UPI000299E0A9|nr:hypothetical protein [Marinilabilia salmonicolor]